MLTDHFPILGLRVTTPRLELRLADPEEVLALAGVAAAGVHDPGYMPFLKPWTLQPKEELCRGMLQSHWAKLAQWKPADWSLNLAAFLDGEPIGLQNIRGEDFGVTRRIDSGSWLGLSFQRRGLGVEMRAGALELAFAGLGAEEAVSTSFQDNAASQAVSARLGYRPDGLHRRSVDGELRVDQRMRLTREDWERHRRVAVTVEGLQPCLAMFGVAEA